MYEIETFSLNIFEQKATKKKRKNDAKKTRFFIYKFLNGFRLHLI